MFNELLKDLEMEEHVLFTKASMGLIYEHDHCDPAMIIHTIAEWVLGYGDLTGYIKNTDQQFLQSLYGKLYEPCMKWLVENIKPESADAVKWELEGLHNEIMEAA